jgi:7,8-dihydropterin-6-yl-methyl-4-(beta-D-ribofuranosyl)aminobenzene 5'-phosphate synthase
MTAAFFSCIGSSIVYTLLWIPVIAILSRVGVAFCDTSPPSPDKPGREGIITLTVLFDNYVHDETLKTGWGFACLVSGLEKTILFDTGGDGTVLLSNMRTLGVEPSDVDIIVLSHDHHDHTGGLAAFLAENHKVTVFVPISFSEGFKRQVQAQGATVVDVHKPCAICQGAHSTRQLGAGIKEQALCISTANGLFVVTGCAHPGIVEMIRIAATLSSSGVYGTMGGFHMKGFPEKKIGETIEQLKAMGVTVTAPCHCSGDLTRAMMRQSFSGGYVTVGVGSTVRLGAPADACTEQGSLSNLPGRAK